MKHNRLKVAAYMIVTLSTPLAHAGGAGILYDFNIDELTVDSAINAVAQQSKSPAIFPFDQVRRLDAPTLNGRYTIEDALSRILINTGLSATITPDGVITVMALQVQETHREEPETMTPTKTLLLSSAAIVSAAVAPITATAQTPTTSGSSFMEEVIVTATKRSESVNDVPIAINALSGDALSEFGISDGDDIVTLYPNLSVNPGQSYATGIAIRGVGTQSVHISTQQSVGVYVDDVTAVSPFVSQLSLFDMERIEVLRGPQNTLYGRNTTGGAINYITKKAEVGAGTNGYVRGDAGNGGLYGVEGAVGMDLGENFAVRVAGAYETFDGFYTNVADGSDYGAHESVGARVHLGWEPIDQLSVNATYSFAEKDANANKTVHVGQKDSTGAVNPDCALTARNETFAFTRQDCWVSISASQFTNSPALQEQTLGGDVVRLDGTTAGRYLVNYTDDDPLTVWSAPGSNVNNTKFENFGLTVDYDLDFATLTSISSYLKTDLLGLSTFDVHSFANPQEGHWKTFSQEFRLASKGAGPLKWLAGLYYVDEESEQDTWIVNAAGGPGGVGVSPMVLLDATYSALSGYGQIDYDVTDRLTATFGVRYTDDELAATYRKNVIVGVPSVYNIGDLRRSDREGGLGVFQVEGDPNDASDNGTTIDDANPSQELSEFAIKVGLDFQLTDETLVYGSFSNGFKGGAFDNRGLGNGDSPISPEYIDAYEVGFKSTLADGDLQLNGSAFLYDWQDQQLFEVVAGAPALVNADNSEVKGIELDAKWQIADGVFFQGGVGFLEGEITENANALLTNPNTNAQIGNQLSNTPDFTANALLNYRIPLASGTIVLQPSIRHVGNQYAGLNNRTDGYFDKHTYVNMRGAYDFGSVEQYEFAVRIDNVFEEEAAQGVFNAPGTDSGYSIGYGPRSVVASLQMDF